MPGQQHVAMDTAPELFLREVLGFLSGQAAALGTRSHIRHARRHRERSDVR
jgi:hypothetical protein